MEQVEVAAMRRDRIEARLEALGLSPWAAAARAGKSPNFIYDFFEGRKKSFKGKSLGLLAAALECSVDYLQGRSDEVGRPPEGVALDAVAAQGMRSAGVVEAGVWRTPAAQPKAFANVPVSPDPRYSSDIQQAYVMRGKSLENEGIFEGDVMVSIPAGHFEGYVFEPGRLVIVQRSRPETGEVETSGRVVAPRRLGENIALETRSKVEDHEPILLASNTREARLPGAPFISSVVLHITRLF